MGCPCQGLTLEKEAFEVLFRRGTVTAPLHPSTASLLIAACWCFFCFFLDCKPFGFHCQLLCELFCRKEVWHYFVLTEQDTVAINSVSAPGQHDGARLLPWCPTGFAQLLILKLSDQVEAKDKKPGQKTPPPFAGHWTGKYYATHHLAALDLSSYSFHLKLNHILNCSGPIQVILNFVGPAAKLGPVLKALEIYAELFITLTLKHALFYRQASCSPKPLPTHNGS